MSEDRRNFIRNSAALGVAAPALLSGMQATNAIKVGLVGCGGRGTGAAAQALAADDYSELVAMADIDMGRIDSSLESLQRVNRVSSRLKVDPAKKFVGLDAFEKLINSGVDVVLLATPPGFRPPQLRACIEAGKHVFCEKPMASDMPGCRHVMETVRMAKEKQLSLVAGFCWRYHAAIKGFFDQIHQGTIGDVLSYYGTYLTSPVKPLPPPSARPAGMSDIEWQVRNWYNFSWLSADGYTEQAIHSVDKMLWAKKDATPLSCTAVGGRTNNNLGGNILDHIEVNYVWPDDSRGFIVHRQIVGCHNENRDYVHGSKGRGLLGSGPIPKIIGETNWSWDGPRAIDMYQAEHDVLFQAIRRGKPVNDGDRMMTSTIAGLMGRMAAYTGQQITWDMIMKSEERLVPENLTWDMKFEPMGLPQPGIYKYS
jgi:myo-inositol 2-dehydrogenase / D-chiro-inositol 1-dehydrogenase